MFMRQKLKMAFRKIGGGYGESPEIEAESGFEASETSEDAYFDMDESDEVPVDDGTFLFDENELESSEEDESYLEEEIMSEDEETIDETTDDLAGLENASDEFLSLNDDPSLEGFTVVFSYDGNEYSVTGKNSVPLQEILKALDITEEIRNAYVIVEEDEESRVSVEHNEDKEFTVYLSGAFETEESIELLLTNYDDMSISVKNTEFADSDGDEPFDIELSEDAENPTLITLEQDYTFNKYASTKDGWSLGDYYDTYAVLDLNGHYIECPDFTINSGNLVIRDSKSGGEIRSAVGIGAYGNVTLESGTIRGSQSAGVTIGIPEQFGPNGRFVMNGGLITDSTVGVTGYGIFVMNGGIITGNTSPSTGAGVSDVTFYYGGGTISGNTYDGIESNVYTPVVVTSKLPSDAFVGITADGGAKAVEGSSGEGEFDAYTLTADDAAKFSCDNELYELVLEDNQLTYKKKVSSDWDELKKQFADEDEIVLDKDIICDDPYSTSNTLVVPEGKTMTLNLNGHKIDRNGKGTVIRVAENYAALTIIDGSETEESAGTGMITGGDRGIYLGDYSKLNVYGGRITGNNGAGIVQANYDTAEDGIHVKGSPYIQGNYSGDKEKNVVGKIFIDGKLNDPASIGVTYIYDDIVFSNYDGLTMSDCLKLTIDNRKSDYAKKNSYGFIPGNYGKLKPASMWRVLQAQFDSASTDEESPTLITLDDDYYLENLESGSAEDVSSAISLSSGRYAVLDLNGHLLDSLTGLRVSGNLTVKDSSEKKTGTITTCGLWSDDAITLSSGVLNLQGGNISNNERYAVTGTGTINMTGGKIFGNAGAGVYGDYDLTFNMSGGEISDNCGGVYASDVNISGGRITDNISTDGTGGLCAAALLCVSGNPVIRDNYIYGAINAENRFERTGGIRGDLKAPSLDNPFGDTPAQINLITVTGRLLDDADINLSCQYIENDYWIVGQLADEYAQEPVTGYKLTAADAGKFHPDNALFEVIFDGSGEMPKAVMSMTGVSEWESLRDKLKNAGSGGSVTITLDKDVVCELSPYLDKALYVPEGVDATIDLAGHTIDRALGSVTKIDESEAEVLNAIVVEEGGKLTLKDSSEEKKGVITGGAPVTNSVSEGLTALIRAEGELCLEDGNLLGNSGGIGIYTGGYRDCDAKLSMSGGTISNFKNGIYIEYGHVAMSGGTITDNACAIDWDNSWDASYFRMSGGVITQNDSFGFWGLIPSVSGAAQIYNNGAMDYSDPDAPYYRRSNIPGNVILTGPLTKGANLAFSDQELGAEVAYGLVDESDHSKDYHITKADVYYMSYDGGEYSIGLNNDGVAVICEPSELVITADMISDIPDQVYTGQAINPEVSVTYEGIVLTEGEQYTVAISNNTNAGTATVTVNGKDRFSGTAIKTFKIEKADNTASINSSYRVFKGGNTVSITPEKPIGDVTYSIKGEAHECSISAEGVFTSGNEALSDPVIVNISVAGNDNYKSVVLETAVYVDSKESIPLEVAIQSVSYGETVADPVFVQPVEAGVLEVLYGGTLRGGAVYETSSQKPTQAGKYSVSVVYTTDKSIYAGSCDFTISPKALADGMITLEPDHYEVEGDIPAGKEYKPILTVKDSDFDKVLVENSDYTIDASSVRSSSDFGKYTITATGAGNYDGTVSVNWEVTRIETSGDGEETYTYSAIEPQTYTGSQITPEPVIRYNGMTLVKDEDYTLSYKNNINAASKDDSKAPTVVVKGKGAYANTMNITFDILKRSIGDGSAMEPGFTVDLSDRQYTGKTNLSKPVIKFFTGTKTLTLKKNTDYTLTYAPADPVEIGEVKVTITGIGNYSGKAESVYNIVGKGTELAKAVVEVASQIEYTGSELRPEVKVFRSKTDRTLVDPSHYVVEYSNNVNVGKATVAVHGKNGYGELWKNTTFKITAKPVKTGAGEEQVELSLKDSTALIYSGTAFKPEITAVDKATGETIPEKDYTVSYKNNKKASSTAPSYTVKFKGNYSGSITKTFAIEPLELTLADVTINQADIKDSAKGVTAAALKPAVKYGKATLKKGTDYTVEFTRNTAKELQDATVRFKGNYSGSASYRFRIYSAGSKLDLSDTTIFTVSAETEGLEYSGAKIEPEITVSAVVDGGAITLVRDKDYTVKCSNNINAAGETAPKKPVWKVTGKGAYKGTVSGTFTIGKKTLSTDTCTITVADIKSKNGSECKPKVTVIDNDTNKALKVGKDYTVTYINNKNIAEIDAPNPPAIVITAVGNYDNADVADALKTFKFRIYANEITKAAVVGVTNKYFSGAEVTQDTMEVYSDSKKTTKLTKGVDYDVVYADNTKVGNATVTIVGKGAYGGTKTVKFKVLARRFK